MSTALRLCTVLLVAPATTTLVGETRNKRSASFYKCQAARAMTILMWQRKSYNVPSDTDNLIISDRVVTVAVVDTDNVLQSDGKIGTNKCAGCRSTSSMADLILVYAIVYCQKLSM